MHDKARHSRNNNINNNNNNINNNNNNNNGTDTDKISDASLRTLVKLPRLRAVVMKGCEAITGGCAKVGCCSFVEWLACGACVDGLALACMCLPTR